MDVIPTGMPLMRQMIIGSEYGSMTMRKSMCAHVAAACWSSVLKLMIVLPG
jgi:hypothetical protein